jgi:hypothetical protein
MSELDGASLESLERIYRETPLGPPPSGSYRGRFLCWLPTPGARRWHVRLMDGILFVPSRFGVDFDRNLWWFVTPRVALGRFEVTPGPSRWRETDTFRLTYGVSKLPRPVRGMLYDEVKPLSDGVCLGLGGVDAETGEGDHFYFVLER